MSVFITDERRASTRVRDHVVINERDPEFERFSKDPSGSILQIVRIWASDAHSEIPSKQFYVGTVRNWECGGWVSSRRELSRLYHRANETAREMGQSTKDFRSRLSQLLLDRFVEK